MLRTLLVSFRTADRRVWRLAVAETLCWAGMYYLFPALMLHWERDQGWSKADLSGALTLALAISALCAPLTGRLIDRGHGRVVLTTSALLGSAALVAVSFADTLVAFFAAWLVVGFAMSGCLYEACFAFLTHSRTDEAHPHAAKRAITVVTLAAGFASTLAFPSINIMAGLFGWRWAVLLFAALIAGVAAPLFWRGAQSEQGAKPIQHAEHSTSARGALKRPVFWLLAWAFSSTALTHGMLISHLLPLLDERHVAPAMAVLAASLIGPMQVFGRVLLMALDHRFSMVAVGAVSFTLMIGATALLFFAGASSTLLIGFALMMGAGYGVTSITKPVVTASVMGRANFGAIAGAMAVPYMMAYAFSPSLAAGAWGLGGYDLVLVLALGVLLLGFGAYIAAVRERP